MTLRAVELARVCDEILPLLAGSAVQKIVQPDDMTVLLQLHGRAGGQWLLMNASAQSGRIHLLSDKPAGTGEAAPAFCMLLRKHLLGARVAALRAIEGERACELELLTRDDAPRLRLFLFGTAAQLQLVTHEGVLGVIGPARRNYAALPPPHPQDAAVQVSRFSTEPISRQIETAYANLGHEAAVDHARKDARDRLQTARRKVVRLVGKLAGDLARTHAAEARRKDGDLLLAHLHEIPRGASEVTLADDFTDGSPLAIALDPARSAQENAERLYKEQRRLHRARGALEARIADTKAKLASLDAQLDALSERSDAQLLADAREMPTPTAKSRTREARSLPYKEFTSKSGVPIFVGRGAAKNDALTFKVARGNDLWLHARDVPGAHVVVPLEGGRDVDAETLVDAATLAAHHSNAREDAQVDVGYALRKHVRKPRGSAPGSVLVSQQKTVRVRMEAARLARLLATARR